MGQRSRHESASSMGGAEGEGDIASEEFEAMVEGDQNSTAFFSAADTEESGSSAFLVAADPSPRKNRNSRKPNSAQRSHSQDAHARDQKKRKKKKKKLGSVNDSTASRSSTSHSFSVSDGYVILHPAQRQTYERRLPSDVEENKDIKEKKMKKLKHLEKEGRQSPSSDRKTRRAKRERRNAHKKKRPSPDSCDLPVSDQVEPMQYDSSSSSVSAKDTAKPINNPTRESKKLTRAPVPPGSDYDDAMKPECRETTENPVVDSSSARPNDKGQLTFPVSLGVDPGDVSIQPLPRRQVSVDAPSDESASHRSKSFTKAVVAAAVSDATVHGRVFSQKDVRSKGALSELSSDPVCSQYLQTVGQSFKTKPPPISPVQSVGRSSSREDPASPSSVRLDPLDSSVRSSSRRGSFLANRNRSRNSVSSSSLSSPHQSLFHSHEIIVSEAVKEVLEDSDVRHEMKYKIRLLESIFDDIDEKDKAPQSTLSESNPKSDSLGTPPTGTPPTGTPPHRPGLVDEGDAKVASRSRRKSRNKRNQVTVPPRDIEEDASLVKEDLVDLEKGLDPSDESTKVTQSISLARRRSSATSMESLFRWDEAGGRRRWLCCVVAAVIFLCGIIGVVIAVLVGKQNEPVEISSFDGLTMAPTSFQYDVLPEYTQAAFVFPSSPQARAYYWLEHDDHRTSLTTEEAVQRFVLATLYYATRGDHWEHSLAWLAYNKPACTWYTHQFQSICTAEDQYHTLSLPDNSLEGTLPEELELLSSLSIVQLQNNQLRGTLPSRIWSSWNHLAFLNVYNNSLTGTIPPEVALLANAEHLNTLSLRSNQFSGTIPSELGLLQLEFLSLSGNRLTGALPSELGLLSNAEDLYLYNNRLVGTIPSSLGLLSKLTRLELHDNDLTGTVPFEVCNLISQGSLSTLTVDCASVRCTCGCDCTASTEKFESDTVFDKTAGDQ